MRDFAFQRAVVAWLGLAGGQQSQLLGPIEVILAGSNSLLWISMKVDLAAASQSRLCMTATSKKRENTVFDGFCKSSKSRRSSKRFLSRQTRFRVACGKITAARPNGGENAFQRFL